MHRVFFTFSFLLPILSSYRNAVCFADKKYAEDFFPKESVHRNVNNCHSDTIKTDRLREVRKLMIKNRIEAYIICNENENLGVLTPSDQRLESISGFTGTIGTAVITLDNAALWTDGRTFQSAIDDVNCGWTIYRKGGKDSISLVEWIYDNVKHVTSVGACPFLMSSVWWSNFQRVFEEKNSRFVPLYRDLVDSVWTDNRPPRPSTPLYIHPFQFAGETWQNKIKRTLQMMEDQAVDVLLITNLDEIAWLFNLRANDFPFDPYFISFCVIDARKTDISLYIIAHETKLNNNNKSFENQKIHEHLNTSPTGCCVHNGYSSLYQENGRKSETTIKNDKSRYCVDVREYNPSTLKDHIGKLSREESVRKIWVPWECSQAFVEDIPQEKLIMKYTPPLTFKAAKNDVEISGMKNSTLRDSVFLTRYFADLEDRMKDEVLRVQEIEAEIKNLRKKELFNTGPSGTSLIGIGPTAEVMVPKITDDVITGNDVFLCDMGSQYLDGTTDIARSFVYGSPTERQKDIYTRLLMTHINLARKKFAVGSSGRDLDSEDVRAPLREIGIDFPHEIGHMVAAHGVILEGPASISNVSIDWKSDVSLERHIFDCETCNQPQDVKSFPDWRDYILEEGMVFSNEPSFYGKDEFGMRIENTMFIRKDNCDKPCYAFEQLVYIPYESKLIKPEMLTADQVFWLKNYYKMVEEYVIPELKAMNDSRAVKWLTDRTNVTSLF